MSIENLLKPNNFDIYFSELIATNQGITTDVEYQITGAIVANPTAITIRQWSVAGVQYLKINRIRIPSADQSATPSRLNITGLPSGAGNFEQIVRIQDGDTGDIVPGLLVFEGMMTPGNESNIRLYAGLGTYNSGTDTYTNDVFTPGANPVGIPENGLVISYILA